MAAPLKSRKATDWRLWLVLTSQCAKLLRAMQTVLVVEPVGKFELVRLQQLAPELVTAASDLAASVSEAYEPWMGVGVNDTAQEMKRFCLKVAERITARDASGIETWVGRALGQAYVFARLIALVRKQQGGKSVKVSAAQLANNVAVTLSNATTSDDYLIQRAALARAKELLVQVSEAADYPRYLSPERDLPQSLFQTVARDIREAQSNLARNPDLVKHHAQAAANAASQLMLALQRGGQPARRSRKISSADPLGSMWAVLKTLERMRPIQWGDRPTPEKLLEAKRQFSLLLSFAESAAAISNIPASARDAMNDIVRECSLFLGNPKALWHGLGTLANKFFWIWARRAYNESRHALEGSGGRSRKTKKGGRENVMIALAEGMATEAEKGDATDLPLLRRTYTKLERQSFELPLQQEDKIRPIMDEVKTLVLSGADLPRLAKLCKRVAVMLKATMQSRKARDVRGYDRYIMEWKTGNATGFLRSVRWQDAWSDWIRSIRQMNNPNPKLDPQAHLVSLRLFGERDGESSPFLIREATPRRKGRPVSAAAPTRARATRKDALFGLGVKYAQIASTMDEIAAGQPPAIALRTLQKIVRLVDQMTPPLANSHLRLKRALDKSYAAGADLKAVAREAAQAARRCRDDVDNGQVLKPRA